MKKEYSVLLLGLFLQCQLVFAADLPTTGESVNQPNQVAAIAPTASQTPVATVNPVAVPKPQQVAPTLSQPIKDLPTQAPVSVVAPAVLAVAPSDPYSVEIPISGYGDIERQNAFVVALQQLLVSATGNPNVITKPQIKAQMKNAATMVQSFSYSNHAASDKPLNLFLKVQFNPSNMEQLLQQATQSVWSGDKPTTLVWLTMVYTPMSKAMLDDSSNDVIVSVLHKNAQNFGMPIIFPTLDLQDAATVKPEDVCNQKTSTIQAASTRYGVHSVLAGCVIKPLIGNSWNSRWTYINKGKTTQWNTTGTSADDVVTQAMLNASQSYGKKAQQQNSMTPEEVVMRIANVKGMQAYTSVVQYLRTLSPVTQVDLLTLEPNEIQLKISCIGGKRALLTALSAQTRLAPNNDATAATPAEVDLDYRLTDAQ